MRRIGVTGHVNVSEEVAGWATAELTRRLSDLADAPLNGVTCLARGVDQIFAKVVLALSGTFDVVLPARDYPRLMADTADGETFRELLGRASSVETMPFERSSRDAYLAASETMLSRCDLLLAVWDGEPSRNVGDTAHVVERAREHDVPVEVLWPPAPPGPAAPATPAGAPGPG